MLEVARMFNKENWSLNWLYNLDFCVCVYKKGVFHINEGG